MEEMASTCSIDRVLLDLELLKNRYPRCDHAEAIRATKFLKTFLMCARKQNHRNEMYLESHNVVKQVSLPSFLSCIEDVLHKFEEDFHDISLGSVHHKYEDYHDISLESDTDSSDTDDTCFEGHSKFKKKIQSFKQKIILVYFTLASSRLLQPNSGMTDDELMEFIDLILQNLADLTTFYLSLSRSYTPDTCKSSDSATLSAQVQALEVKLTFLKSFIHFAKLRGTVDIPPLLLAHFEVVALSAARLSYMCSVWDDDIGKVTKEDTREFCSMICEQQQKIKPVDCQVYEIYMEVLRATRSSKSLDSPMMDKQILNNFNDSLISCLWELLCYSSSFMDSMKDEMQMLYAGLRFLRSILRQHQEKMDEQNERIGALLSEAGIIICSPSLNRVKEGKASFLESTEAPDCYDMLAETNNQIKRFENQISGSSMIESIPSSHSLTIQEVWKPSSHMVSKGKIPTTHEVMVGLDDEANEVIDRLISGTEHREIVPIVGMAGLGKTTLAQKVYNDSSVVQNFHIRLWCTVSQEFNMKSLLMQILRSDGKHSRTNEDLSKLDENELLQKLYQRLKRNRYLVVFDDVWDIGAWNELRCSFPDDDNRSRILFTSRFSNVAAEVQYGGKPYNLRPLSEKDSFELLQKKVFGKEDCPQTLCGSAMEIAKKCRGLPLAVIVVAGVLAAIEDDILVWEEFAKCLTLSMVSGTDECKKALELSYGYLPYHLKACLLYFAAFREDEKIGAKKLMRLWIAEGFVGKIEGKRSEDIAEEYLMELIGRNLVMESESGSIGGVKTCYIHDLIFEFCKTEAKEKDFLQVLQDNDELSTFVEHSNLCRLSICSSFEDFMKSRLFCPHLGSLLFSDFQARGYESMFLNILFLFCIYKRLEVLNLEHINLRLKELPTEVESLLCLRYLALTAMDMQFIPPSIAKLSNLETFFLNSCVRVSMPDGFWHMKKLRHVHILQIGFVVIPFPSNDNDVENLSTLPNLDTLSKLFLNLDREEDQDILRRIPNVRRLKIGYNHTKRVCCNLSRLECLESLTLDNIWPLGLPIHVEFSFPENLKKLRLAGEEHACSYMSLIEQLPNLEVFKLYNVSWGVKRKGWELMKGGFPKLRVLTLDDVNIVEWTETDPDSDDYFPCLQRLNLHSIRKLNKFPSCLERISTLETIEIRNSGDSVKSLVWEIKEAQEYYGNENLKIIYGKY